MWQRLPGAGVERGCPGFESEPSWISHVKRSMYHELQTWKSTCGNGEVPGKVSERMQGGWAGKRDRWSYVGFPSAWHTSWTQIFAERESHGWQAHGHAHHQISTERPTVCRTSICGSSGNSHPPWQPPSIHRERDFSFASASPDTWGEVF